MTLRNLFRFLLENRTANQTIQKNATWLLAGQIMSRLFRAGIVIYAARVLGVESWGAFSYALGVATFLTVFSDIGIGALLTREGARSPEIRNRYLGTAIGAKLMLIITITVLAILFFPYLTNIEEAKAIMPILIFVFVFDTLRDLGSAFARALERMEIESLLQMLTNFIILILGLIVLSTERTGTSLAIAYAAGSGLGLLGMVVALRSYLKNAIQNFDRTLLKGIFTAAWPFGLFGIMGIVMLNTDIIMLGWMKTSTDVGYYSAAQKLIQLLYVIPTIFAASLFPTLTKLVTENRDGAKQLLEKAVSIAILVSFPVAAAGIILAPYIINIFFGSAYAPATLPFQILMSTIMIIFPSALIGNAVFAYGEQRRFVHLVAVAVFGNVLFNFLLIPSFGIAGSAAATVITQLITNGLIWMKMRRLNGINALPALRRQLGQFLGINSW